MQLLATFTNFSPGAVMARYWTITNLAQNVEADGSYQERMVETRLAWRAFTAEPVIGAGPGHLFEWTSPGGHARSSLVIDTSLSLLAKFGAAGGLALLALVIAFGASLRNMARGSPITVPQVALVAFAAISFLNLPLSALLEDKGFSFGLLFLLALSLPNERGADQIQPGTHDRGAT